MASLARSLSTRVSRIEKPKPLKTIIPSRHSFSDKSDLLQHSTPEPAVELKTPDTPTRSAADDLIMLLDIVSSSILNKDYTNILPLTNNLTNRLKFYGAQLEEYNEERLDKIFEVIRNGAHDILIDRQSRLNLLQLVELRASQWQLSPGASVYYASKSGYHLEVGEVYGEGGLDLSQQQFLGPGDVLKSSGKYSSPTRVPGKNYCKDEVVIRNSDSGKVMGIKGRRVHMIEELSETVISFQRVNPGAKERLVQITGPSEDKIIYAKNLIEDTIKRNASPVREIGVGVGCREAAGSNSSINSSASDESNRLLNSAGRTCGMGKDSTEFKYSVHVQNDVIHISSTNLNLLNEAFSLLDSSYAGPEDTMPLSPQTLIAKAVQNLAFSSSNSEQSPSLPPGEISHSESNNTKEEMQESDSNPSRGKTSKGLLIQYSRDFLMQCSKYKASQVPPAEYAALVAETPAIWTKPLMSFDALAYQKKWLETNGRIATHPTTAEDFLDSD